MPGTTWPLALHSWTLGNPPIEDTLAVASATGYLAIELNWQDIAPLAGTGRLEVFRQRLNDTGVGVAAIGAEPGWLFARGKRFAGLMAGLETLCAAATRLDCRLVMSAVGIDRGPDELAATNIRTAFAIAAGHGLDLALEPSFQNPGLDSPERLLRLVRLAGGGPGLVLDSYHLYRSGASFHDVPPVKIAHVHVSDVQVLSPLAEGPPLDRLAPGLGEVDWRGLFALLRARNFAGVISYEAPNPRHWRRPAEEVALEGREAIERLAALRHLGT